MWAQVVIAPAVGNSQTLRSLGGLKLVAPPGRVTQPVEAVLVSKMFIQTSADDETGMLVVACLLSPIIVISCVCRRPGRISDSYFLNWHVKPMSSKIFETLTGMYFTMDAPDGSYSTGQVIRLAAEGLYFVRFDGNEVTLPLELVTVGEMLDTTEEEYKLWRFFDTIEERDTWIEWLDAPSTPRVISLVKPTK